MALRAPGRAFGAVTQQIRSFATSPICLWKSHTNALAGRHANVPEYPYGPVQWYKQANKGLYGGQMIRFGNNVGEKSEKKTRRSWHPNIITRKLQSNLLARAIRVKLTTRVLRTIDKVGGIDAYLLGSKPSRIRDLGMEGWKLRFQVMSSPAYQKLAKREQEALLKASEARVESQDVEETEEATQESDMNVGESDKIP